MAALSSRASVGRTITRRLFLIGAVIVSSVCLVSQAADLDTADRIVVASRIYALVQQYFAHWEGVSRGSVEDAYRTYVDRAVHSASRQEFDLATLRFVASLHNGHTQFVDSEADGRPLKFRLLEVEGRWVVIGSQESRLPRGTIVRTIDGIPAEAFVHDKAAYVPASNDRIARTYVFLYLTLFGERIALGLDGGQTVVIDRATPPDAPLAAAKRVDGRWLQDGVVAYIRVSSFGDPADERTAIDLVHQFGAARSVIVDVRGNGGGTTPRQLISALMNRPWRSWMESSFQRIPLIDAMIVPLQLHIGRENPEQQPSADAYSGRVFILADRYCVSACEDFVMPFKSTGRGTVVGELTHGSSGNPYRADLGNGMRISIGAMRYRFPDGSAFEGVGIAPDIAIERRIADIVAGRDAPLERAIELAAR
jgi:carboxyl-terminal processing protease